jgi:TPR repeat protein
MASAVGENGGLIAFCSDDPDDWNTWSDYERNIRRMVLEYNEEAFVAGEHLLGFDWYRVLDMIKLLARINVNYTQVLSLQEKLKCIRKWANWRVYSCRPDDVNEHDIQIAENNYKKADKLWKEGKRHKAIEHYERAGLYDHPWAYEFLGHVYDYGLGGITPDIQKALHYYEEGADDDLGDCAFELGIIYREGRKGLEPDLKKAYEWIRKASLLETCNAGNALGELFENGWGCERNLRKALYWYDVSQTGVENGDILREKLRLSGDNFPLRLDGFDYELVHYIQEPEWWEKYYLKNNMLLPNE